MKKIRILMLLWLAFILVLGCGQNDKVKVEPDTTANLKVLQQEVKQYPDSVEILYSLLDRYRDRGMYDSALALLDRRLQQDKGNIQLWSMKATFYFEHGDTLKAANALEEAIAIYPMPEYLVALGTIYAEIKNPNAVLIAEHLLNTGSKKYFDDAYFIKGLYNNYTGKYPKAISVLDSCLALDYSYMYAYREKAIALCHLERYQEAVQVLTRAVTLQNSYDEGYFWLGKMYEKLGKTDKAIESYQNALLYDPNYIEAKEALKRLQGNSTKNGK